MSTKLMDIAAEYRKLAESLMDMDVPDDALADTLEGERYPLEQKCTAIVWVAANMDALADSIEVRERALAARKKAMRARAERLRALILVGMKVAQVTLIETPEWKLRVKKSPPKVVIDAPTQVPAEFMRFPDPPPPEIDKELIRTILSNAEKAQAVFDAGKPLNAEQTNMIARAKSIMFAHLERGEHLEIK
jgi:hypothetical protein